ncbi:MAG: spermidine synthase [Candidatus Rokuibacteriota bacterium]
MNRHVRYQTRSPLSGLVKVIDVGPDRRLVLDGSVLSTYPRDGDWTRARQEYWGEALSLVALPPRPSVLFVGLGGGTQLHLLRQQVKPRQVTAIERDPLIVRIAQRWFGLEEIPGLEFLCAEAETAVAALLRARGRFDFIMEDCTYDQPAARSIPLALSLVRLLSRRGALVVNRHRRPHALDTALALATSFEKIRLHRVRREADNILVCASGLRPRARTLRAPAAADSPADPACLPGRL